MRVEHEICSTICGTPVRFILDHKNLTDLAGRDQGRKKSAQEMASVSFGALQGPLNGSRTPEINSNQSESVGRGPLRVHFRCPWHIWGPLGDSKAKLRPFLGQIFSFPDPTLPTQSDFYGPKWVVQVSHT